MERKRFSLELSSELIGKIDQLKSEWGLRSRGAIVERLLQELLGVELAEDQLDLASVSALEVGVNGAAGSDADAVAGENCSAFNEKGALVLVARGHGSELVLDLEQVGFGSSGDGNPQRPARNTGIDLPGFVSRRSDQLKQSLNSKDMQRSVMAEPLPRVSADLIDRALECACAHWQELYGKAPSEAVVEAAMVWLATDIWPQSDQSDGRPFTWSLACAVVEVLAPKWQPGPPSFGAVMVIAGLLEDPFSASTLDLRLPTLIRRFVHRFRKRKTGTSFQTLEHTMTLHGALKLLQLPTAPGHRLTLAQIREAYRDMALNVHPDSGGSEEGMRKVNEAYQLLKELYRNG